MSSNNNTKRLFKNPLPKIGGGLILLAALAYWFFGRSSTASQGTTFTARRGPLQIAVLEGGNLESLASQEIRSQIKGFQGTKILTIVEEGYLVTEEDIGKGKVLVELDGSDLKQRITTEELKFQSTVSSLIEARQAYEIQLNQNLSDIKASEQKSRFAKSDIEKYLGDKNTEDIIKELKLYETPFTNDFERTAEELSFSATMPTPPQEGGPASFPGIQNGAGRGAMPDMPRMAELAKNQGGLPEARLEPAGPGRDRAPGGRGNNLGEPGGRNRPADPGGRNADSARRPRVSPAEGGVLEGAGTGRPVLMGTNFPAIPILTKPIPLEIASLARTNSPIATPDTNRINLANVDFSKYAKMELLGDGSAKQSLRKLEDDLLISTQELNQAIIQYEGTKRLFQSNFVAKSELDRDDLSVKRSVVKVESAKTAKDLFIKYEFPRAAEEWVSKFEEALRILERTRKEALSKLAQARARLKSAEGTYRIAREQLQELYEQQSNCVIRALKPGLVVYGGASDDRHWGNEEPIREGATVRERQSIITIPDMSKMAVRVKIHESHIKKIAKGLKARIQVDAFPDEKLMGEVIKVAVLPDSGNRWLNPDMKVYITSVSVDGFYPWLKPGMSAKVEIIVKELPNAVYVPIQAVVPQKSKHYCYVASAGSTDQREVEIGDFNDEFIEIKKGIKEGENVLLRAPLGSESELGETEAEENEVAKPVTKQAPAVPGPDAAPVRKSRPAESGGGPIPGNRSSRS